MAYCEKCGTQLEEGAKFCSNCGKENEDANVCPHCGASVNDGDVFCTECGKLIDEKLVVEGIEEIQEPKTLKDYLPYIIGIIVVLVLGGAWWYNSTSSQETSQEPVRNEAISDSIETVSKDTNQEAESLQLIKDWYKYVLGGEPKEGDMKKFLSSEVMKKIWTDDYDGVYEFWHFRTSANDSNPDNDVSKVEEITSEGGGWYSVTYKDMGWDGKTKVKVVNGKIVDLKEDSSWDSGEVEDATVETSDNQQSNLRTCRKCGKKYNPQKEPISSNEYCYYDYPQTCKTCGKTYTINTGGKGACLGTCGPCYQRHLSGQIIKWATQK